MSVYIKLLNVQSELKSPKNQFNGFGKYNYRSCEDILEALKPILLKHKATVVISDDIVFVEGEYHVETDTKDGKYQKEEHLKVNSKGKYYVKATVKFIDVETGEMIENSAYAMEEFTKKGMDSSQITGSCSSYARKYALNGMFAIDDTKDSDSTNTHGVEPDQSRSTGKLSAKQVGRLLAIGLKAGIKEPEIKKVIKAEFGKDKIEDLSKEDYNSVCIRLEAKVK